MFRALLVYAICVPLAIVLGYMLTGFDNRDRESIGIVALLAGVLIFPLLMKWHYPLLVFSVSLPATVFFLPGQPSMFIAMVAASLTISVVERIINRNQPFLTAAGVQWPLLVMLLIVFITAKLTGGFGLKSMGSDVYGGKKYVILIVGILSFFAFIARPIPKKYANLYITLFCFGAVFNVISDVYPIVPSPLHFIYAVFPPSTTVMTQYGGQLQLGTTRLAGVATAAGAIFYWMIARHGIRDNFLTTKIWRPPLLGLMFILIFLGGFRNSIIGVIMVMALLFYLEKLHYTPLLPIAILLGFLGAALLVPMASHLPFTFQRALAFLPLDISSEARMDAEDSSNWRLEMWSALLPQVPKYLLLGKGYAFSSEEFNESMGSDAMFQHNIDASQDALALSSDFHSGPFSLVIPFGIWAVLAWLWYWAAGLRVVWRNYRYGDPDLRHINVFLFASFVVKCVTFVFIFGSFVEDVGAYAAIIGLSIAFNHGVKGLSPVTKAKPAFVNSRQTFPAQPALQR